MQRLPVRDHPLSHLAVVASALAGFLASCAVPVRVVSATPSAPVAPRAAPHCGTHDGSVTAPFVAPATLESTPDPSPANALAWVRALASPEVRGRRSASSEEHAVSIALAHALVQAGWQSTRDDGELCQGFRAPGGDDRNVVARFGPDGGAYVVLGAHYDALGTDASGVLYPGADDDASGVAALLEVARILPRRRLSTGVLIVFFGGEEPGLYGSRHFVADPWVPLESMRAMINLDMVGRQLLEGQSVRVLLGNPRDALGYVLGGIDPPGSLGHALRTSARALGVEIHGIPEAVFRSMGYGADSVAFSPHMPTVFISSSMHDDYHRPTDSADRIDAGQIARAASLVLAIIDELSPRPVDVRAATIPAVRHPVPVESAPRASRSRREARAPIRRPARPW